MIRMGLHFFLSNSRGTETDPLSLLRPRMRIYHIPCLHPDPNWPQEVMLLLYLIVCWLGEIAIKISYGTDAYYAAEPPSLPPSLSSIYFPPQDETRRSPVRVRPLG